MFKITYLELELYFTIGIGESAAGHPVDLVRVSKWGDLTQL
jgi:hypothetical protein